MIEINLLPEELKTGVRDKKGPLPFDVKYLVYAVPGAVALLLIIHILLIGLMVFNTAQWGALQKKLRMFEPQRKQLEQFNQESKTLGEDAKMIKQFSDQRINWAQKLNRISQDLPSGIWLEDLMASPTELSLRCSAFSLEGRQMAVIKNFIDNLEKDTVFFKDFKSLDLGTLQTRDVAGLEVTGFNLKGTLKAK